MVLKLAVEESWPSQQLATSEHLVQWFGEVVSLTAEHQAFQVVACGAWVVFWSPLKVEASPLWTVLHRVLQNPMVASPERLQQLAMEEDWALATPTAFALRGEV